MATNNCLLSVVMNSGVIHQVMYEDVEKAEKRRRSWLKAEEMFDIRYSDNSIVTINKKFVESISLTPINNNHLSHSLDNSLRELSAENAKQMRINNIGSKLQDIQYSIDRLPR